MARLEKKIPRVVALHDSVAGRPRLAAYLASERRIGFNEQGIFRHYKEWMPKRVKPPCPPASRPASFKPVRTRSM